MIRTQVQLPDEVYRQAKRIAAQREISLAEVVRRGLEHMIRTHPASVDPVATWRLPEPKHMGGFLAPPSTWRELSNEPRPPRMRRR
jgi:hypothetical protein